MKKILLLSMIFVLFSCNEKKQNQKNLNLTKKKEFKLPNDAIPFVYRGHLYLQGNIDTIKGNFLFDTGAYNLYFDSTYYANNDFNSKKMIKSRIEGAGNNYQNVNVIIDSICFKFYNHSYTSLNAVILQLKPILGDFADGIIGRKYFEQYIMEISYEHEYIKLYNNADSINLSEYNKIKMRHENDNSFYYVPLSIKINDSITITSEFLLDLGSGCSILTSKIANQYKLHDKIKTKIPYYTKYGGVGGESYSNYFMSDSLSLGYFALNNVIMEFSDDKRGALASDKYAGILGNEILEHFDIVIDFINNYLYIKPNKNFNKEFKFSRLGFKYVDRSKTKNAWIVIGLYKNSNAESAGLKIDDKIIKVNGIDIDSINYEIQQFFKNYLNNLELTIIRDNETQVIKFALDKYYF